MCFLRMEKHISKMWESVLLFPQTRQVPINKMEPFFSSAHHPFLLRSPFPHIPPPKNRRRSLPLFLSPFRGNKEGGRGRSKKSFSALFLSPRPCVAAPGRIPVHKKAIIQRYCDNFKGRCRSLSFKLVKSFLFVHLLSSLSGGNKEAASILLLRESKEARKWRKEEA